MIHQQPIWRLKFISVRSAPNDRKLSHRRTRDVNRDSGTDSANGGWLRRLVRRRQVQLSPPIRIVNLAGSQLKRSGALNPRHCCHSLSCPANARPLAGVRSMSATATRLCPMNQRDIPLSCLCARTQTGNTASAQTGNDMSGVKISMRWQCRLTKKAEPPPTRDVNRDSGTDSANGGWLRRLP